MGLTLRSSELTGSLLSRKLARGPVLIFSCLPFKLTPDTDILENVYAGDRLGGKTGLTNQLYRWIVVLCNAIVRPPSPPPREDSHCTVNRPRGVTELVGKTLDMKNSGTSLLVESGEGVGTLEVIHSPAEERLI